MATAKQLAARAKFTQMIKSKSATKKKATSKPAASKKGK
jgi:hypothetical protein